MLSFWEHSKIAHLLKSSTLRHKILQKSCLFWHNMKTFFWERALKTVKKRLRKSWLFDVDGQFFQKKYNGPDNSLLLFWRLGKSGAENRFFGFRPSSPILWPSPSSHDLASFLGGFSTHLDSQLSWCLIWSVPFAVGLWLVNGIGENGTW